MSKKFIAVIILSLVVIGVARHYNNEVADTPAYQNHIDQGVKAFKVSNPTKM